MLRLNMAVCTLLRIYSVFIIFQSHCVFCKERKICQGTNIEPQTGFIHSKNIEGFTNCTVIDGDLSLLEISFDGDAYFKIPPMDPAMLGFLESVEEIRGYLMIQGNHGTFTSLGFLRNLRIIRGDTLDPFGMSLHIFETSLKALEFQSFREITRGKISIIGNADLCYIESVNWDNILASKGNQTLTVKNNRADDICQEDGHLCSTSCTQDGCWGNQPEMCLTCAEGNGCGDDVTSVTSVDIFQEINSTWVMGNSSEITANPCKFNCTLPTLNITDVTSCAVLPVYNSLLVILFNIFAFQIDIL